MCICPGGLVLVVQLLCAAGDVRSVGVLLVPCVSPPNPLPPPQPPILPTQSSEGLGLLPQGVPQGPTLRLLTGQVYPSSLTITNVGKTPVARARVTPLPPTPARGGAVPAGRVALVADNDFLAGVMPLLPGQRVSVPLACVAVAGAGQPQEEVVVETLQLDYVGAQQAGGEGAAGGAVIGASAAAAEGGREGMVLVGRRALLTVEVEVAPSAAVAGVQFREVFLEEGAEVEGEGPPHVEATPRSGGRSKAAAAAAKGQQSASAAAGKGASAGPAGHAVPALGEDEEEDMEDSMASALSSPHSSLPSGSRAGSFYTAETPPSAQRGQVGSGTGGGGAPVVRRCAMQVGVTNRGNWPLQVRRLSPPTLHLCVRARMCVCVQEGWRGPAPSPSLQCKAQVPLRPAAAFLDPTHPLPSIPLPRLPGPLPHSLTPWRCCPPPHHDPCRSGLPLPSLICWS
jgi:hypothetical protein